MTFSPLRTIPRVAAVALLVLPYLGQEALAWAYCLYWAEQAPDHLLSADGRNALYGMGQNFAYDINVSYAEYAYGPVGLGRMAALAMAVAIGRRYVRLKPMLRVVASYLFFGVALFVSPWMGLDFPTIIAIVLSACAFSRRAEAPEESGSSAQNVN